MAITGTGISMTVDGVEWPCYFTIKLKKENDMSEKQEVKAGDVWRHSVGLFHIVNVHNGMAAYWSIDRRGDLGAQVYSTNGLIGVAELIERDGKRVREFEYGYYPCQIGGTNYKSIRLYSPQYNKMRALDGKYHSLDTYEWIGKKINLEELK